MNLYFITYGDKILKYQTPYIFSKQKWLFTKCYALGPKDLDKALKEDENILSNLGGRILDMETSHN